MHEKTKSGDALPVIFGNHDDTLSNIMGKYERFHENMFLEYFTEARDIGNLEVISAIAARCDLDVADMMIALQDGLYLPRLAQARKEGKKMNLTGVPTFIINEKFKIVGAQPIQVFQETFGRIGN